ncbi:DegT/DnrJ/EryC1/StrS family aminotransferase [Janibacter melonis]|uniref:DegT/DnrJ/EryC1/StrS family aminotransferase n=1 Tax=Janibacter melonis TaxID=262209 RepID=UPI002043FE01|nr:DegT/DnrJ/EryC1/StrS family aminotransferase [Janibacter melonis]MCM3553576.1 DegT/DnrJ/EryC1/StrS family aminotransferase [Janibacter melonis]
MHVPLVDLRAAQAEILDEIRGDVDDVLSSAGFVGGPHVVGFEEEYAQLCGTQHCVGVANGTDAVEIALRAVGVGPGDEVVLPANTFVATAEAVARIGARSVLVDVDPDHLLVDPAQLGAVTTERTRAIAPVHLYGQLAPMGAVLEHADRLGLPVVEDAAQSQGATQDGRVSGSLGRMAATSFYPGKNLGAAGDAGAVTTDDDDLARTARLLGAHGSLTKYVHEVVGFNSRLDAIQAVVLRAKLRRLQRWNACRREAAERYASLLDGLPVTRPAVAPGNEHVWHLYVIQVDERDRVLSALHEAGVGAGIHYPEPVHLTRAFADLGYGRGDFPVTEAAADRILSLPIYPHITPAQQEHVAQALADALGA